MLLEGSHATSIIFTGISNRHPNNWISSVCTSINVSLGYTKIDQYFLFNDILVVRLIRCRSLQWYYHFMLTHGVMESFAVAVFRNLPRSHPVYKLLRPHLQTVTVINLLARNSLILADSAANNAMGLGDTTAFSPR